MVTVRSKATWDREGADASRSLQPRDWLLAGMRLMSEGGVDAVRITRLADALGVTRGSFYWHFKDRQALLDGLIEFWRESYTDALVSAAASAPNLSQGILDLFSVWIGLEAFDPRVDSAVRAWARSSDAVRDAVEEADTARVQAITDMFVRNGYDRREAFVRARVVYFTQIGYYALGIRENMVDRLSQLEAYYMTFTGRMIDRAAAERFRQRHLGGATEREAS